MILLPQPSEKLGSQYEPPCLAFFCFVFHFNTVFRWSLISQFSFMCGISHMFLEAVLQQSCPVLCCPCLQSFQVHTGSGECPDIHPRQCSKGCNPSTPRYFSLCTPPRPVAFLFLCSHLSMTDGITVFLTAATCGDALKIMSWGLDSLNF